MSSTQELLERYRAVMPSFVTPLYETPISIDRGDGGYIKACTYPAKNFQGGNKAPGENFYYEYAATYTEKTNMFQHTEPICPDTLSEDGHVPLRRAHI
mgnify:CR=1 FL=1